MTFHFKYSILLWLSLGMQPTLVQEKQFYIATVKSEHKAAYCGLHYFLTNIVHCHIAEVNLINIGTFNFYVQSKDLFHAHFGH